jgi:hypothetical protein
MLELEGGCLCGQVRYRATTDGRTVMHCFCRDCQRATGSQSATFVAVPQHQLAVEGPVGHFTKESDAGRVVNRFFCKACGSQLYSTVEVMPGVAFVKLGTLDDPSAVTPGIAIWTASRPSWAHLDPALPAFERNPPG